MFGDVKTALLSLSTVILLLVGATAGHAQSALDGFDPNANGSIRVVVVQPDGRILIGGSFTSLAPNGGPPVARNRIARLNSDGTVDTTFDPNANDNVISIALQPDGKILVGGRFNGANSIGGQNRNRLARLDPVTGLADSFNPNANDRIFAIAIQSDGKILVGGLFHGANSIGGQARNYLARLDQVTGLADSFDPNPTTNVDSIVVQPDGKILVGGGFWNPSGGITIGGQNRNCIARLDPVTGLADSFNPDADNDVYAIAVQADGKILAGGAFGIVGGQLHQCIVRLDPVTGAPDSFYPNPSGSSFIDVFSIVLQPDSKILVGGTFDTIGGELRNNIARLDPMTGLADSFDPNANSYLNSIALQADGKVVAGGDFTTLAPNGGSVVTRNKMARLEADGRFEAPLASVVSRKVHGATTFDITLPSMGSPGVECRSGGGSGNYQLVFSFANTLTSVGNASVTDGTGSVSSRLIDSDAHNYVVNLTGVGNAQTIAVNLTDVNDSAGNGSASIPISMRVLLGDTNGNGTVNASDIGQTKGQVGQAVTSVNFRNDVNVSGSITASDVAIAKSQVGTSAAAPAEKPEAARESKRTW